MPPPKNAVVPPSHRLHSTCRPPPHTLDIGRARPGTRRRPTIAEARGRLEGVARMAKKGRAIYLVYTDLVDDRHDEEFNTWYNTRHLPQLTAIPGILDAARYVAVKGG